MSKEDTKHAHTDNSEDTEVSAESFFEDVSPEEYDVQNKPISTIPVIPELGMALGLLAVVMGATFLSLPEEKQEPTVQEVYVEEILTPEKATSPANLDMFEDVELKAESAVVWDIKNQKILFNKNADEARPLASVTKLMTALVAYELMSPEDKVRITQSALMTEGDSGFTVGETFTMEDLANLTLVSSSNDGATALSATAATAIDTEFDPNEVFVKAMNVKAEELGLTNTNFKNSTGLDLSPSEAGAHGTAREMALLMEYILLNNPDSVALTTVDETIIDNEDGQHHTTKNTNRSVNEIDGLIASKTGYTLLAGGNLVVAFNAGLDRPIVVSVLGSSYNERFSDTLALIEKTREYLNQE